MKSPLAEVAVAGLFIGSMLWAAITDMCKDEIRTRIGRLPYALIRMAVLRIPHAARGGLTEEWQAELDFILHGTDGLPATRLLRGASFSVDLLLRGAPAMAREIAESKTKARAEGLWTTRIYPPVNFIAGSVIVAIGAERSHLSLAVFGITFICTGVLKMRTTITIRALGLTANGLCWMAFGFVAGGWFHPLGLVLGGFSLLVGICLLIPSSARDEWASLRRELRIGK